MLQLSDDLIVLLSTFLDNKERKILRLVNQRLHSLNPLHIKRVFISPSYKNIEVFQAIASHPVYCKQVKEIIWDDARFECYDYDDDSQSEELSYERRKNKYSFRAEAAGPNRYQAEPGEGDSVSIAHEDGLSQDGSWELYKRLYKEQESIIHEVLDVQALKFGLTVFPILERVTVTGAVYPPLVDFTSYLTPLIRSFPRGFKFPRPRTWLYQDGDIDETLLDFTPEDTKKHYHGVMAVLAALAEHSRLVPEFIIDVKYAQLGLTYRFFEEDPAHSPDLRNLETLCVRGLRRLDLAIDTYWHFQNSGLKSLPKSHLKAVLKRASSLENFSLHIAAGEQPEVQMGGGEREIMETLSVIPLESWPRLKQITVSGVPVIYSDLINFLRRLLETSIESVTLINVGLAENTYVQLLIDCRDELGWRAYKPRFTIAHDYDDGLDPKKVWVDKDIARFLAGEGLNPFDGDLGRGDTVQYGFGTLQSDFDDSLTRPFCEDVWCHWSSSPEC